jgi:hypothetical protein
MVFLPHFFSRVPAFGKNLFTGADRKYCAGYVTAPVLKHPSSARTLYGQWHRSCQKSSWLFFLLQPPVQDNLSYEWVIGQIAQDPFYDTEITVSFLEFQPDRFCHAGMDDNL